jgi:tRNA-splicing ligase RtcB (3'-phosphate/5'-hydroxy nucleic acid ligase)
MNMRVVGKALYFLNPSTLDHQTRQQVENISQMPFVYSHVAVMPDAHLGKGATVGTVIATDNAIIPAAVGVDIACGMIAVKTNLTANDLPDSLRDLRLDIERRIPLGAGAKNDDILPSALPRYKLLTNHRNYVKGRDYTKIHKNWHLQLGSLGSGNHFIEICLDELDHVWAVLHSGSRGIGNQIAQIHIKVAKALMEAQKIRLADKDLAYLEETTSEFSAYITDLMWCQDYALLNREEMMDRVLDALSVAIKLPIKQIERINCHHNFTQRETHGGKQVWITRKGAIQMKLGQKGIIPGSMGERSFVVSGKQNPGSFHSAPHGAGRAMSRTEAKKRFNMDDFDTCMKGIECRRSASLLDEHPNAYKNIDDVMENSIDLVSIDHVLKQILNVKGD